MKVIIIITIIVLTIFLVSCSPRQNYDTFASCLTEKGIVMYGAFWCPHCLEQKKMFGDSFQYINYVECSLPDGKTQIELCTKRNITGYPTWEFENGSRSDGALTLTTLAEKTGCNLQ